MIPTKTLSSRRLGASCLALTLLAAGVLAPRSEAGDGARGDASSVGTSPSILYSRLSASEHPDPIWVSATELTDDRGNLDWDMLGDVAAKRWRRIEPETEIARKEGLDGDALVRRASESECPVTDVSSWPSAARRSGERPPSFIEGAQAAFAGTVVERTPGFLIGKVATVLTVEVTETFVTDDPTADASPLYVAFPQGRFNVAGKVFCGKHQKGPDAPEVGSSVLVLSQHAPIDEEASLFQVSVDEIASMSPDGQLVLPEVMREDERIDEPVSWQQLLERVRGAFEKQVPLRGSSDDSAGEEGA